MLLPHDIQTSYFHVAAKKRKSDKVLLYLFPPMQMVSVILRFILYKHEINLKWMVFFV